ncbi:MAG: NADPH-dependent glutamate synthase [Candidatus Omnitrophica bacterium]|nr:NADPH-dependent glutamate synthase [Candidatus Omnitrophota bacterium]
MVRKMSLSQRRSSFREVSLGFSLEEAKKEALRCLQCKNAPCIGGCPVSIDIPGFIRLLRQGDASAAKAKIKERNNLPGVCGRVCPQEGQCQKVCVLNRTGKPIKIGYLERFAADFGKEEKNFSVKKNGLKVAVIGSGPASLTCAADLAKEGFEVSVFEALHKPGGVMVYGIPEFRLPKKIVEEEIEFIKSLGVEVVTNFVLGKTATLDELRRQGFRAFFLGLGAGAPLFLGIKGENCVDVYSANEFLVRVNLMKAYLFPQYDTPLRIGKRVGVIGGGNVAFDCARVALRMGAEEVKIIYRRTKEYMPAREEEIQNAEEEGVVFEFLTSPKEIVTDEKGRLNYLLCVRNELKEKDSSGRPHPEEISGSDFKIELDSLIVAIGTKANPLALETIEGLKLNRRGYIEVDENFMTSLEGIFAGGDIVTGSATVISAMGQGKKAATAIKKYLASS